MLVDEGMSGLAFSHKLQSRDVTARRLASNQLDLIHGCD